MEINLCKFAVAFLGCWLIDLFLDFLLEQYETRKKDKSSSY